MADPADLPDYWIDVRRWQLQQLAETRCWFLVAGFWLGDRNDERETGLRFLKRFLVLWFLS
jgi:hypothetical protein